MVAGTTCLAWKRRKTGDIKLQGKQRTFNKRTSIKRYILIFTAVEIYTIAGSPDRNTRPFKGSDDTSFKL
jgi:hypothetical protein